jgi:hypothetical protein
MNSNPREGWPRWAWVIVAVVLATFMSLIMAQPGFEDAMGRLHLRAISRELNRVKLALGGLKSSLELSTLEFAGVIGSGVAAFSMALFLLSNVWTAISFLFRESNARRTHRLRATNAKAWFVPAPDNKVSKARFGNLTELVVVVTIQ